MEFNFPFQDMGEEDWERQDDWQKQDDWQTEDWGRKDDWQTKQWEMTYDEPDQKKDERSLEGFFDAR